MGFFEVVVVFILFVILPAVVLNGVKEIKKAKGATSRGGSDLRASDLKAIVREAVEEAIGPMSARLADLEDRVGDEPVAAFRARLNPALLADEIETDLDADAEAPVVTRRVRS